MLTKIQYTYDLNRLSIITANNTKILVEEQNLFDGNFLIFSDVLLPIPAVYISVPQEEFEALNTRVTETQGATDYIIMNF